MKYNFENKMDGIDLLNNIENNTIKTCFFDPQYRGVMDKLKIGNEGKRQKKRFELDQMDKIKIKEFISLIDKKLLPSGHLFLWVDKFHLVEGIKEWIEDTSLETVDMITWHKKTFGMGYRSRRVCEYLIVLQKLPKKAKGFWTLHDIPDVWIEKIEKGIEHPHSKPIELQKKLIEATTKDGDIIVDPCSGSFSVLKCCNELNRIFLGCDIKI